MTAIMDKLWHKNYPDQETSLGCLGILEEMCLHDGVKTFDRVRVLGTLLTYGAPVLNLAWTDSSPCSQKP